ncbi:MAG TPA: glycosyltransferase [Planctomycetota bacterium]|nr:glycosyltransferase [Planctomycetota bacterium]
MRLSVVIPVYNAAGFLEESLRALAAFLEPRCPEHEIVAVNDGSTDDSLAILRQLESGKLRIVSLPENRGKFAAIREGMQAARGSCRIFTDADVPFERSALLYAERLVNERGFHVVIGDRTLPDSLYSEGLPWARRLTSRLFRHAVRLLVTGGIPDSQAGLKGFRADVADALFPLLTDARFGGDIELLYIALKYNLEIRRIPVRLQRQGASTVRALRHAGPMLRTVLRLRRNWRRGLYRSEALAALAAQRYWEA